MIELVSELKKNRSIGIERERDSLSERRKRIHKTQIRLPKPV